MVVYTLLLVLSSEVLNVQGFGFSLKHVERHYLYGHVTLKIMQRSDFLTHY